MNAPSHFLWVGLAPSAASLAPADMDRKLTWAKRQRVGHSAAMVNYHPVLQHRIEDCQQAELLSIHVSRCHEKSAVTNLSRRHLRRVCFESELAGRSSTTSGGFMAAW
jgi:hypothetical protein